MSQIALSPPAGGTGVFTIAAPATNTNRTLTLPDATGTVLSTATPGVPVNGPTFRSNKSSASNQVIAAGVFTKITYADIDWNINSNYSASTSRFTPTVAGYYLIIAANANNNPSGTQFAIYKNNAFAVGLIGSEWGVLPSILFLNGSTDFVEAFIFNSTGVTVFANSNLTYFSGSLLRSDL